MNTVVSNNIRKKIISIFKIFATSIILIFTLQGQASLADDFPKNKPIKILIGYTVGTAPDILARHIGQRLTEELKVAVAVENYPSAGGRIAADKLQQAEADGHTLSVSAYGPYALLPFFEKIENFNNFTPISMIGRYQSAVAVPANSKWKDAKQMVNDIKSSKVKSLVGVPGLGTVITLAAQQFQHENSLDVELVSYPKSTGSMIDLAADRLDLSFVTIPIAMPFVQKNTVKLIAVTGNSRSSASPETPTLLELGLTKTPINSWYGFFAPPKTPASVINKILEITKTLRNDKKLMTMLTNQGIEPVFAGPDEIINQWGKDDAMWRQIVVNTQPPKKTKE